MIRDSEFREVSQLGIRLSLFADGFVGAGDVPFMETESIAGLFLPLVYVDPPLPGCLIPRIDPATPDTLPAGRRVQHYIAHVCSECLRLLKERFLPKMPRLGGHIALTWENGLLEPDFFFRKQQIS